MQMHIQMHVSEVNAAIALFSGAAEKIREQAMAQSQLAAMPAPPGQPPVPPVEHVEETSGLTD
jgi:hypothetical protein